MREARSAAVAARRLPPAYYRRAMAEGFSDEQLRAGDRGAARARALPARPSAAWRPPRLSSSRCSRARWPRAAGSTPRTSSSSRSSPRSRIPSERLVAAADAARRGDADRDDGRRRRRLGAGPRAGAPARLPIGCPPAPLPTPRRYPMDIRFLGHATFELSDGDSAHPDRPVPGAEQPEGAGQRRRRRPDAHPAHPRPRRPHRRRGRGREAHRRPLRRAGRDRELARRAGSRERLRPEPRRHGRVRLGLGEAGAGLPQLDDARRHASPTPAAW